MRLLYHSVKTTCGTCRESTLGLTQGEWRGEWEGKKSLTLASEKVRTLGRQLAHIHVI